MEMDIDMEQRFWNAHKASTKDTPHPAGNRATRRAALKTQRTKARQRSRKNQSRIAVASVRRVGGVENVASIRRVIRSFEEVSAAAMVFGRSLDGVMSVSFSPDAGSR